MTELEQLQSYCSVCDAPPGACDHNAHRYLDEIVYKRVPEGWACPNEAEKHRFWNPPHLHFAESAPKKGIEPKPIQQIIVELEGWMLIEQPLETELRATYQLNPRSVTLIAQHVVDDAEAGRLRNPAGLLVSKLRSLAGKSEQPEEGDAYLCPECGLRCSDPDVVLRHRATVHGIRVG